MITLDSSIMQGYRIGIFRSVSVGISWYLPYQYQRKSYIFFGENPFFPQKGGTGSLFEEKGGTGPLFDTASPPFAEKRKSRQISHTDRKYRPPSKSDNGKIPIAKKLLVTPWYRLVWAKPKTIASSNILYLQKLIKYYFTMEPLRFCYTNRKPLIRAFQRYLG